MSNWNKILTNVNNNNGGDKSEVKYTSFPEGTTTIRVIEAEPYSRYTHWIPQANSGKGLSVDCIGAGCPVCEAIAVARKNKSKERVYSKTATHAINIINRTTGQHELLDKGNGIFGTLATINAQMGDLRNFDINITKTGKKLGDIKYTILPSFSSQPFTQAEEELKKEELFNIRDRELLSKEQILALMSGKSLQEVLEASDTDTQSETPMDSGFSAISLGDVVNR